MSSNQGVLPSNSSTTVELMDDRSAQSIESLWRSALRRLGKNKIAVISGWFLIALILLSIFGPMLMPDRKSVV